MIKIYFIYIHGPNLNREKKEIEIGNKDKRDIFVISISI